MYLTCLCLIVFLLARSFFWYFILHMPPFCPLSILNIRYFFRAIFRRRFTLTGCLKLLNSFHLALLRVQLSKHSVLSVFLVLANVGVLVHSTYLYHLVYVIVAIMSVVTDYKCKCPLVSLDYPCTDTRNHTNIKNAITCVYY